MPDAMTQVKVLVYFMGVFLRKLIYITLKSKNIDL